MVNIDHLRINSFGYIRFRREGLVNLFESEDIWASTDNKGNFRYGHCRNFAFRVIRTELSRRAGRRGIPSASEANYILGQMYNNHFIAVSKGDFKMYRKWLVEHNFLVADAWSTLGYMHRWEDGTTRLVGYREGKPYSMSKKIYDLGGYGSTRILHPFIIGHEHSRAILLLLRRLLKLTRTHKELFQVPKKKVPAATELFNNKQKQRKNEHKETNLEGASSSEGRIFKIKGFDFSRVPKSNPIVGRHLSQRARSIPTGERVRGRTGRGSIQWRSSDSAGGTSEDSKRNTYTVKSPAGGAIPGLGGFFLGNGSLVSREGDRTFRDLYGEPLIK